MKLALSNAALPPGARAAWLPRLADLGIEGIELSSAASWGDAWRAPSAALVAETGNWLRTAELEAVGLHVPLDQHAGMGWFGTAGQREETLAWLVRLSAACRDLGGRTLVLGGGRWRGRLPVRRAWRLTLDFLHAVLARIEAHGTLLCLAPLARDEGDFCLTATECRILADVLEHSSFGLKFNAAAMCDSGEMGKHAVFSAHYGRLELFTADEPQGLPFATSGQVDHAAFRRHLAASGYRDWVCMAQQAGDRSLAAAIARFVACYRRIDNLSLVQRQERRRMAAGIR
ncbi:sugar phosphate isomerase/epimerase family protein [Pseudothauera rhizosphaerae]|uniref:Xylose isomerase-like TIM barrel domain-containing protein n=1 Tax=Pseudothauera rhizosphaerae TaxID=2565932 RepID=A0A4S4A998_9RHOO|nr:TIM barrel protein [Pseudothauera rhizosphaerae]THF55156.1 hypothetical protein E6O51_21180 [Pseudothauera rhizosphaerae]